MNAGRPRGWATWSLVLILIAAGAGAWVLHEHREAPVGIQVAQPAFRDISNLIRTNGDVSPVTEFQARANFPGMVEKVSVELGDKISAGHMLVTMKDPFAAARVSTAVSAVAAAQESNGNLQHGGSQEDRIFLANDLRHATLEHDQAERGLAGMLALEQKGAASGGEIAAARKRLDDDQATLDMLQARRTARYSQDAQIAGKERLADANASLGAARVSFANAHIASPIAGTVYAVSVLPYDFVPMGADLMRVADLNQMQVRAYFDEPDVGRLRAGQSVEVTWDGRPGRTWHGHIRTAPVGVHPQGTRSVAESIIRLDDSRGDLLPNTHVMVTVPIDAHTHVLSLPRRALETDGRQDWVYVVHGDRLVRTPVKAGLVNLDFFEVRSGLQPTDTVAVRAVTEQPLTDGMLIQVVP